MSYPDPAQIDTEIKRRIDAYSADFWASDSRHPREGVHALFQYPAMMVPGLQQALIQLVCELQPTVKRVLDPFVGSGTTMTSSMLLGLDFTGQDINPLAVLVSRAKAGPYTDALRAKMRHIVEIAQADANTHIEADFPGLNKWFTRPAQIDLSKLRRAIRQEPELWARRFMWVTLAETVRMVSNSRTSTYKLHIRPKSELEARSVSAAQRFSSTVEQSVEDYMGFKRDLEDAGHLEDGGYRGRISIHLQDSTAAVSPSEDEHTQHDLLITSPPYGDNTSTVPYGQFSYLPLQWIDLADIEPGIDAESWLRTTQEIDRRSLGGKNGGELEPQIAHLSQRSEAYRNVILLLEDQLPDRKARVTRFFFDFDGSINKIVPALRPNAYLIWIVGNRHVGGQEIPADQILVDILSHHRVSLVTRTTRKIAFRRMAARNTLTTMMRQEHILVFRKTGE